MIKPGAERVKEYVLRQRARGLSRVCVWVPETQVREVRDDAIKRVAEYVSEKPKDRRKIMKRAFYDKGFIDLVVMRGNDCISQVVVDYLIEEKILEKKTPVYEHASFDQIRGKNVLGVLPYSMACECATVTVVPLDLTPEMKGKELSIDDIRKIAGAPTTYRVQRVI